MRPPHREQDPAKQNETPGAQRMSCRTGLAARGTAGVPQPWTLSPLPARYLHGSTQPALPPAAAAEGARPRVKGRASPPAPPPRLHSSGPATQALPLPPREVAPRARPAPPPPGLFSRARGGPMGGSLRETRAVGAAPGLRQQPKSRCPLLYLACPPHLSLTGPSSVPHLSPLLCLICPLSLPHLSLSHTLSFSSPVPLSCSSGVPSPASFPDLLLCPLVSLTCPSPVSSYVPSSPVSSPKRP